MYLDSYKKLIVWQKSIELVKKIYILTNNFPQNELYGITSQMRRAAISIPSKYSRRSIKEKSKRLFIFSKDCLWLINGIGNSVNNSKRLI